MKTRKFESDDGEQSGRPRSILTSYFGHGYGYFVSLTIGKPHNREPADLRDVHKKTVDCVAMEVSLGMRSACHYSI
jgi:hypothetical protein